MYQLYDNLELILVFFSKFGWEGWKTYQNQMNFQKKKALVLVRKSKEKPAEKVLNL